jgi:hypothetical protein
MLDWPEQGTLPPDRARAEGEGKMTQERKEQRRAAATERKNETALLAGGAIFLLLSFCLLSAAFPLVKKLVHAAL